MATKAELQEALDQLWEKYGTMLASLNDALDELDKKPKEVIVEKVVEKKVKDKESEDKLKAKHKTANDKLKEKIKSLQQQLKEKPKEVVKEIEVEVIVEKEVPVEVEKMVEVERKVEVPKEVVVTHEVEVPGPERIVEVPGPERVVEVPGPEKIVYKDKIVEVEKTVVDVENEARLIEQVNELQTKLEKIRKQKTTEVIKQVPVEVAVATENDLAHTARLLVDSELNKEDLTEQELIALLQRSSEEDVQKQIGFWATSLPDQEQQEIESHYIGKK